MFGYTKLSPEEKTVHEHNKRILELQLAICKEQELRQESLNRAKKYNQELSELLSKRA